MNGGPSKYYPHGEITFDDSDRRIGAGLAIILWQSGVPAAVYP
jgi:branched-chain amino acid transport system substrate-binding protein